MSVIQCVHLQFVHLLCVQFITKLVLCFYEPIVSGSVYLSLSNFPSPAWHCRLIGLNLAQPCSVEPDWLGGCVLTPYWEGEREVEEKQ